jgi:hypothetical protein
MTHQGLFRLPNPFASSESTFGAISEWAASQFSLTVYESKGVVWADECIHHVSKEFQGPFLTRQPVSFP